MKQLPEMLKQYISRYPGRSAGAALGCVIGILLLTMGPKRTLILFLFTVIGLIIGNLFDSNFSLPGMKNPFAKKRKKPQDYTDSDIDIE